MSTLTGDVTAAGDLAVNGGDQTSSATTFNLLNATVTTLNFAGAGTAITMGAATGYTNLRHTLFVNDTANAQMTTGVTVNQGGADNEIVSLKSSDVAHGVTGITETDTFARFLKQAATTGGLVIEGLNAGAGTVGLFLQGTAGTVDTAKTTGAGGTLVIQGSNISGVNRAATGANANLLAVRDDGTTRFILDADGDSHQDVGTAWTNFDDADDLARLQALAVTLAPPADPLRQQFLAHLDAHRDLLTAMPGKPLVTFTDDGCHFVNWSRLAMLHTGAIRQLGQFVKQLAEDLHDTRRLLRAHRG